MCDNCETCGFKRKFVNYNHIDKPEQKRCVRELETNGFKNASY